MSLRRDLARSFRSLRRRYQRFWAGRDQAAQAIPPSWMERLPWLITPLILLGVFVAAWSQLHHMLQVPQEKYIPVVIDAPLRNPYRIPLGTAPISTYFQLQSQGRSNHLLASAPSPGTRAYRGGDAVAIFNQAHPQTELFLSPCNEKPAPHDTLFYTPDGLILWLCESTSNQVELRRIGWRFSRKRWQKGLQLGKNATNDIVIGPALIPTRSLSLQLQKNQLHIRSNETQRNIPTPQRLLCLERAPNTNENKSNQPKPNPSSKNQETSNKNTSSPAFSNRTNKPTDLLDPPPPPLKPSTCQHTDLHVGPNEPFRLYARNHPHHAITLEWRQSNQENASIDLLLSPMDSEGLSVRLLNPSALQERRRDGFLIGNAEMYFRRILPNTVRTLDLEEQVHDLILRQYLVYLSPSALRKTLQQRYQTQLPIQALLHQTPPPSWEPYLKPLLKNQFMRARIWMANQALARQYKQQARSLFRIRRRQSSQELLGLGVGGSTLQAPHRNLLQPKHRHRQRQLHPRLGTILTAHQAGQPHLELHAKDDSTPATTVTFLQRHPLELIASSILPRQTKQRALTQATPVTYARSLFWTPQAIYQSAHPFAYIPDKLRPQRSTNAAPTYFVYRVPQKPWWQKSKQRVRSSKDWPALALAQRLANPGQANALLQAIEQRNPGRAQVRKHCGNESKRIRQRWRHRAKCWGPNKLFQRNDLLVIPCNTNLLPKFQTAHCRAGIRPPLLDQDGRPMLDPVQSIHGLYGVVILSAPKSLQPLSDPTPTPHHTIQRLPGSLHIQINDQELPPNQPALLHDGDHIQLGPWSLRYRRPTGVLAFARFRGDQVISKYPEGPIFAHIIAGSVGGPYRSSPKSLASQLPPRPKTTTPPTKQSHKHTSQQPLRKIATTLQPDLQRISFFTARRFLARLDSKAFQTKFRRRYIRNPHKPHAGAIVLLDRRNGRVLSAASFPTFDPNLPQPNNPNTPQRKKRYLRGQITDRFGLLDPLLAFDPARLPPDAPSTKRLEGQPNPIPNYLEAKLWSEEENQRNLRAYQRSGWLLERALSSSQTPGSTIKIVTAMAYAKYLRQRNLARQFPKHHCHGGMLFEVPQRKRQPDGSFRTTWKPSTVHFRCHKKGGHGHIGFREAMASSCNVYFAKLALEMAGIPRSQFQTKANKVRWHRPRYSRHSARYEFVRIPLHKLSDNLQRNPQARILFRTAQQLGFAMHYNYRIKRGQTRQYSSYTDAYWEPGQTAWPRISPSLPPEQRRAAYLQTVRQRMRSQLSSGFFGIGRYFGYASAYPAWQQWTRNAVEPRFGFPTSPHRTFGSMLGSIRGMAFIGFGQNLTASPLQLARIASTVGSGGWLPAPRLWIGDWQQNEQHAPHDPTPLVPRPDNQRILHTQDAKIIREALAQVTTKGTAAKPFAALNNQCLKAYGLRVIGKTGTAETLSRKARQRLLRHIRRAGKRYRLPYQRRWRQTTGCRRRKFIHHYYPEENIADSLFVGTIVPSGTPGTRSLPVEKQWDFRNLSFAILVKNGYHPEGAPCLRNNVDQDRSEAKYLAHDLLLATLQHLGACRDYKDPSKPLPLFTPQRTPRPRAKRRTKTKTRTRRNTRVRPTQRKPTRRTSPRARRRR